jgi:hypothetical protein
LARLPNPRMEHVAQLLFVGKSSADASRGAGYPDDGSAFTDNARRRANRRDVKARVAELQERAAHAAEVDRTVVLVALMDLLSFNIDDYLTPVDVDDEGNLAPRTLDLSRCSRAQLARLSEWVQEQRNGGTRTQIKGHDKVAILALLAKTAGIDRGQSADALTGIGDRLDAALKRVASMDCKS